ncbi:MAG TPA: FtsX-like permease family protein, partial [Vicinamibacterales bacterium]|nr:FtsX-like permease family protein [Vicinamibacterales bacterium]
DVRLAVRETDPELPVLDLGTLTSAIDSALSGPQLAARSISANAVIALLLALTGVYSVVTFASSRRRREIAIRVALGGRRSAVVTMLLRQALAPTFAGIVIGLALAAIATRAIAVLLYGVNPLDPLTYALTAASLTAAAAAASCVPAIRATRVNAALALRAE